MNRFRRQALGCLLVACLFIIISPRLRSSDTTNSLPTPSPIAQEAPAVDDLPPNDPISDSLWRRLPVRYPAVPGQPLPTETSRKLPRIQLATSKFSRLTLWYQSERQAAVKDAFQRCWDSYKSIAWPTDELAPLSGLPRNVLGAWGTTLIDNLDTLWIMDMKEDFEKAVAAVSEINFEDTPSPEINTHEVNVRILGGLLSAYDLSADKQLLNKAVDVGDMLYAAFDTPNRMPIIHWDLHKAARQEEQQAEEVVSASELGSFVLEFTRLSQITGDPKYFDAAQHVMTKFDQLQGQTKLSGMWPVILNPRAEVFSGDVYTMGAEVDSLYKDIPRAYALLSGQVPIYRKMYERTTRTAASHSFFRPLNAENKGILLPGSVRVSITQNGKQRTTLQAQAHYRGCFAGGMFAMGGQLFNIPIHRQIADNLVDGCIWAQKTMPMGIMPEVFETIPCESQRSCPWNEWLWKQEVRKKASNQQNADLTLNIDAFIKDHNLPKGIIAVTDTRYNLRPEMIESMFILYRTTGREDLLDIAWEMFENIQNATHVPNGNAAIVDVTVDAAPIHSDSMESHWMSQTLKYFYLMFSAPDLISMDEYVFNSGGHPFKMPGSTKEPVR
ncbi:hypothetical protein N7532_009558 [Penicillium argentinense]|uniref:alpha-1,2-Mannosidase n=1 Tax=Penicillium argentinense TaxID=1131581 RepID=A0A9W9EZH2_9EURO|nr:uncharacterized protein N7532_009558 [Penicillium argentinense]KAJ5090874.1 hypothetical protein N7532_009558 [Penicillium argentinense]